MARGPSKKKLAEAEELIERWRNNHRSLRAYHKAMRLEYGYNLKLKHHDPPDENKPLGAKQPLTVSTLDLYDITRYASAQIAGSSIYLDVRPEEPGRDEQEQSDLDDAAMVARSVLEEQLHDVDLGYPKVRRAVARMGQSARVGAARLDVVPGGRMGADVVPIVVKPWNISWDTRFMHPLEHGNRVLWEVIERVSLESIHGEPSYGPNRALVKADDGRNAIDVAEMSESDPHVDHDSEEDCEQYATLVVGWLMDDPTTVEVQVGEPALLPVEDRYMACGTCGYTEQDLAQDPSYAGDKLPESMPCPQCGLTPEGQPKSQMHRVERETTVADAPAYEDQHRRIVFAPLSPEAGLLKDEPWPKGLTKFPHMYHVADPFPLEPTGNSQTFLNMDLQSLKNATVVEGFLQMERNKDLTIAKEDSIWDSNHQPYQFDGSGDRFAFVTNYDDLMGIKHFQGSGLNSEFGLWFQTIDGELNKHRGIGQASGNLDQLKGVQVGAIARSMETGDVPVDETLKIFREDEEQFINRWLELLCGAWTSKRWVDAAGPDGRIEPRLFDPQAMPKLKLRVHASPDMNSVDREQMKAASELAKIESPALLRFAAQSAKLPRHVVEELVKELRERLALARPAMNGPAPGEMLPPGMGLPQGQPGLPAMPEPVAAAVS
jgi:hypothetical protein